MKTVLLSCGFALGLGLAAVPAGAATYLVPATPLAAPVVVTDVACRTVVRRVVRPNGTVRMVRTRTCTDTRRPVYRERRVYRDRPHYRPAPRPGVTIRVNP
ncbi:hypothetical protein GCM10008171_20210 [Methylopila jiangsuensis]|uniref:Porin n=1 Tax=Methylopila jiangsuensis TaxID=586230 RepID=A0A9W6N450_9HYPH|nr:hypothetical protein [Methylopila jiangsuensis]MDR6286885.1 hypothetical protein [Methylopila jiangsuensis]GLK76767.1 hypothetical protein GCM10008171_20210 [Methylopila jiangsuensis]